MADLSRHEKQCEHGLFVPRVTGECKDCKIAELIRMVEELNKKSSSYRNQYLNALLENGMEELEQRAEKAEARVAELQAQVERVKALPDYWRREYDDTTGKKFWQFQQCADELEAAIKGEK